MKAIVLAFGTRGDVQPVSHKPPNLGTVCETSQQAAGLTDLWPRFMNVMKFDAFHLHITSTRRVDVVCSQLACLGVHLHKALEWEISLITHATHTVGYLLHQYSKH